MRHHPVKGWVQLAWSADQRITYDHNGLFDLCKQNNMARMMQSAIFLRVLISHDILGSAGRLTVKFKHREFLVCPEQQKTMPNRNVPDSDLICMNHRLISSFPPKSSTISSLLTSSSACSWPRPPPACRRSSPGAGTLHLEQRTVPKRRPPAC